jgi:hypothetical protein
MNSSYTRLEDIDFIDKDSKIISSRIYKDIQEVEQVLINNEVIYDYLKKTVGEKNADEMYGSVYSSNKKILLALKMAFWYYSGKSVSHVVSSDETKHDIDIFNL